MLRGVFAADDRARASTGGAQAAGTPDLDTPRMQLQYPWVSANATYPNAPWQSPKVMIAGSTQVMLAPSLVLTCAKGCPSAACTSDGTIQDRALARYGHPLSPATAPPPLSAEVVLSPVEVCIMDPAEPLEPAEFVAAKVVNHDAGWKTPSKTDDEAPSTPFTPLVPTGCTLEHKGCFVDPNPNRILRHGVPGCSGASPTPPVTMPPGPMAHVCSAAVARPRRCNS